MIPYFGDIDFNDVLNYWGQGCVLLEDDDHWHAYQLVDKVPGGQSLLFRLRHKAPDTNPAKDVQLTQEQFFKKAVLHRPALGPVVYKPLGIVAHLSWIAARGDRIKAIISGDIFVRKMAEVPGQKPQKEAKPAIINLENEGIHWVTSLLAWRTTQFAAGDRLKMVRGAYRRTNHALRDGVVPNEVLQRLRPDPLGDPYANHAIPMLLQYLNTPYMSTEAAFTKAQQTGACVAHDNLWFNKAGIGVCDVWSGVTNLGTVTSEKGTLVFKPLEAKNKAKRAALATLYNLLA